MVESSKCAQCGAVVPGDAPLGLCPNCVLAAGFPTDGGSLAGLESGCGSTLGAKFVPPTPEELTPHFPDLEIIELLGRGGMGVVYKARQKRLDRLVALKILAPRIAQDPAFAERFAREARALAMLSHPQIVAVHDFGQTSFPLKLSDNAGDAGTSPDGGGECPLYYFVMEYVDGVNLRRLLETEKISPQQALEIVPQICTALQFAHDAGVVHRDIKPENILLDKQGRVKIADFGIAKLMGRAATETTQTGMANPPTVEESDSEVANLTIDGQVIGTPQYMAPEQIEHPQEVDHRADIYSLGVVFYQMLTGELPTGHFAPPSKKVHIDVRLDEVVLRAMEKEPERRYQQVSEIKTEVEGIAITPSIGNVEKSAEVISPSRWRVLVGTRDGQRVINLSGIISVGFIITVIVLAVEIASSMLLYSEWNRDRLPYLAMSAVAFVLLILLSCIYRSLQMPLDRLTPLDSLQPQPLSLLERMFPGTRGWAEQFRKRWMIPVHAQHGERVIHWPSVFFLTAGIAGGIGSPMVLFNKFLEQNPRVEGIFVISIALAAIVMASYIRWKLTEPIEKLSDSDGLDPQKKTSSNTEEIENITSTPRADDNRGDVDARPIDRLFSQLDQHPERVAKWGAAWVALAVIFVAIQVMRGHPPRQINALGMLLWQLSLATPIVVPIIGAISLWKIRHSAGRVSGVGWALFDLLFFPLMALNVAIGWQAHQLVKWHYFPSLLEFVGPVSQITSGVLFWTVVLIPTVGLSLIIDIPIVRWAWHAAKRPVSGVRSKATNSSFSADDSVPMTPVTDEPLEVTPWSWGAVPWQIWIVAAFLVIEGMGNLSALSTNPQATIWLLAKCLFIVGLVRGWKWVFVLFQVEAAIHVLGFLISLPLGAAINLLLMVLSGSAYRFYFPKSSKTHRVVWKFTPGEVAMFTFALLVLQFLGPMLVGRFSQSPPAVAEALEEYRQTLVVYDLDNAAVFPHQKWTHYDAERLKNFPTNDDWPNVLGHVDTDPDSFKIVRKDSQISAPITGPNALMVPLDRSLVTEAYATLLFLKGIRSSGTVVATSYTSLVCIGEMEGRLNFDVYASALVKGDVSGRIYSQSYFNLVVTGKFSGHIQADSYAMIYLLGGCEGEVKLDNGAKVYIVGRTTKADLSRIKGRGNVYLQHSDLPPGQHKIGDLKVTVGMHKAKADEEAVKTDTIDITDHPRGPWVVRLVPQIAIVSPPTPRSYYFLGGLPSFPSRLRDVWSSRR